MLPLSRERAGVAYPLSLWEKAGVRASPTQQARGLRTPVATLPPSSFLTIALTLTLSQRERE